MTGFGTASRSVRPPTAGHVIASGADMIPPAAFRMSWRSFTVGSTAVVFMELKEAPIYR